MGNYKFKHFKKVDILRMTKEVHNMRYILGLFKEGKVGSETFTEKDLLQYCQSLVDGQRKPTNTFKGGSWAVEPMDKHIPPDARVEFIMLPTYFAVAILTRTKLEFPQIAEKVKGFSNSLKKGMVFCTHRNLQGSGYYGENDAVTILQTGRVAEFLHDNPKFCPDLQMLFFKFALHVVGDHGEGKNTGRWGGLGVLEQLGVIPPASVCIDFIETFKVKLRIESNNTLLYLSGVQALQSLEGRLTSNVIFDPNDIPAKKFDLIVGEFPFGRRGEQYKDNETKIKITTNPDWVILLKLLSTLEEKGFGLFFVEPRFVNHRSNLKFIELLNAKGFFINGFVCCPEGMLSPETSLTPILAIISRKPAEEIFVGELTYLGDTRILLNSFIKEKSSGKIEEGIFINPEDWRSLSVFKAEREVTRLLKGYKDWDKFAIKDLVSEFVGGKQNLEFVDKPNTILFPNIGVSPVVTKPIDAKNKPQNYFQFSLKKEIVLAEYLALFFSSEMGKAIRRSFETGGVIPHINKRDVLEAKVPIPPVKIQKNVVRTYTMLSAIKEKMGLFESELALNPKNATEVSDQIEGILDLLNELTDADKIRSLIRKGETKTIEFKQTLSLDVKKDTKEKYIELAVLKTIVAFLNTDGGDLLVGVSDDREICGLKQEISKIYKDKDNYLKHFKNLIKDRIGPEFYDFIDFRIVEVDDENLLLVTCKASSSPCYLDKKDFYVRTTPATDKLEGPALVQYIREHFNRTLDGGVF